MKRSILIIVAFLLGMVPNLCAHCQVPCGIYDDEMRIHQMEEHITTIEKSIKMIQDLSQAGEKNYNQIVRWVNNKEDYAKSFSDVVVDYYMTQRLKPVAPGAEGYDKYVKELTLLHEMLVTAMKAKQTTDLETVNKLRTLLAGFEQLYFEPETPEIMAK